MPVSTVLLSLSFLLFGVPDWRAQVDLLQKSPDVAVSGTYDLPASPKLVDNLLRSPMLLARLWEAYDLRPKYKVTVEGDAIHVDDPTGIQGDVWLVEQSPNRLVYYGSGALNHSLVPAFEGSMALVISLAQKGSGASAKVDVFIRTSSRFLGFLTRTLGPLVRKRADYRISTNIHDFSPVLAEISSSPQQVSAKLKDKAQAAALLQITSSH
jgi:hypothetical protein